MASYRCPLCGNQMKRDLILFLDHTNQHVIDRIKQNHPEWVESDGTCKPCADYYVKQLSGAGRRGNIGPEQRQKRRIMGFAMLLVGMGMAFSFFRASAASGWRLSLFLPFFLGTLGLIQAREKTCALLAELGSANMDSGPAKIEDQKAANELKRRGRAILIKSVLIAALLTGLLYYYL